MTTSSASRYTNPNDIYHLFLRRWLESPSIVIRADKKMMDAVAVETTEACYNIVHLICIAKHPVLAIPLTCTVLYQGILLRHSISSFLTIKQNQLVYGLSCNLRLPTLDSVSNPNSESKEISSPCQPPPPWTELTAIYIIGNLSPELWPTRRGH